MSNVPHFENFEEFWPYYVREHSKKTTRMLHFTGTALGMATVAYALAKRKPKLLLLAPVVGYGMSWIGHFFVEKNRPATFSYPLWSFRGDFRMFAKIVTGTMDAEVERVMSEPAAWECDGNGKADGGVEYQSAASEPGTAN
jgi:hypothetical protein